MMRRRCLCPAGAVACVLLLKFRCVHFFSTRKRFRGLSKLVSLEVQVWLAVLLPGLARRRRIQLAVVDGLVHEEVAV